MRDGERTGQSLPPAGEGNAEAIARQRRLEVLHQLGLAAHPASGQTTTAPASGATPARARARQRLPSRRALWLGVALVSLAVVVVAGLVARGLSLRTSATPRPSSPPTPHVPSFPLQPGRPARFSGMARPPARRCGAPGSAVPFCPCPR